MAQVFQRMQLADWLDDICVRFIINLPREELESVERIIFQIEEGHWYYEDFIRPLDQTLPSINLKQFCSLIFQQCPLLAGFSHFHAVAYAEFSAYKTRVPVRGAIMLNDKMDQAVLVKGWKKGAKWSFPRGKINKDEHDFDCAIREVYEETGYELRQAGIATDSRQSKYIDVTLREQQMRLYVFRGVPLDTHFEPRTRKEISKISWYYITDLPGGKSRKQAGEEDSMKSSQFYMVAPFIGPLKQWIKQQKKREKLHGGINALEAVQIDDSGMGTDLEAMAPELAEDDAAEARHFQSLLTRLNQPSTIAQDPGSGGDADDSAAQSTVLAAELRRLLNVGGPAPEAASGQQRPLANKPPPAPIAGASLLSLLQSSSAAPPQTPFEQVDTFVEQAKTPSYDHSGLNNIDASIPPPAFPYHPENIHSHGPPPYPQPPHMYRSHDQRAWSSGPGYSAQGQTLPSRLHEATSQPSGSFIDLAQSSQPHPPMRLSGPPTSSLPKPKLTAHSLSLLNAFKAPQPVADPAYETYSTPPPAVPPQTPSASLMQTLGIQPQYGAHSHQPAHVELAGTGISTLQPKTAQANTLLNMFRRAPSGTSFSDVGSVDHPAELALPVAELSAITHQKTQFSATSKPTSQPLQVQTILPSLSKAGDLTSATVSGPLKAPDFESVVRSKPPVELGSKPELSFDPVPVHSVSSGITLEAPQALHHPTILDRQTTPADMQLVSPPKTATQPASFGGLSAFDRRNVMPNDQKNTLLSLFGKPTAQQTASVRQAPPHSLGSISLAQQRPSSQASPVSPLPERRVLVKSHHIPQQYTPQSGQTIAKSSRVSSFADENLPGLSTSGPRSPITPAEKKDFLFQYLEDVVNNEARR